MATLILTWALTLMGLQQYDDCSGAAYNYSNIVDLASTDCKYARPENINIELLWDLVEIEKKYNVPQEMRGMVLAAACMESGYNPNALGDRKFSKSGKRPMAVGILQQWPMYEKSYGTDRRDPLSAADSWLKHIVRKLKKVERQCKYKSVRRKWIAAWVTGIRYPKKGGRCRERPKHLKLLNRWHRAARRHCSETIGC